MDNYAGGHFRAPLYCKIFILDVASLLIKPNQDTHVGHPNPKYCLLTPKGPNFCITIKCHRPIMRENVTLAYYNYMSLTLALRQI